MAQRRAMVIGGAGFVGSSLVARLLGRGYDIDVVDNLSTSTSDNLMEFVDWRTFRFLRGDISDPEVFDLLTYRPRVDEIYHLACPLQVGADSALDTDILDACFVGTEHALELARLWDAVVAYARPAQESPQDQTFCEKLVKAETEKLGIDSRVVRISDTYGPRMPVDDSRVIPQFLSAALRGEPVTIYGNGLHTRRFLFIDDLLNALQAVVDDGMPGEVFEVAGNRDVTIKGLYEAIGTLLPGASAAVFAPHAVEVERRNPDTSSLEALGWHPEVSVLDGLAMCLASPRFRSQAIGDDAPSSLTPQLHLRPDEQLNRVRKNGRARAL
ncbi:MAG: NAD-dependent epimerase/dehydratase family protein [Acidimicrobiia bacterium]|nr:NAD-dependent epimerase/dehydratase family protein [Acidimicrobiia bacterium]